MAIKKYQLPFLTLAFILSALLVSASRAVAQSDQPVYKDASAPIGQRVEDLLGRMTLEEKVGQMLQLNYTTYSPGSKEVVEAVPAKLDSLFSNYHAGSLLNGVAVPPSQWYQYSKTVQERALANSRLGIPIIYGIDAVHGANYVEGSTLFPQQFNIAATFNDKYPEAMGRITALESIDLGQHWDFAPILGVGVNPSWPRLYETFGEDPHVAATMGAAFIKALQDSTITRPYQMAATAKHFLGYSAPVSGWDRTPARIPDQYLYEEFVPPFRAAFKAGVKTLMVNSSEINGMPVHTSKRIMTDLLRKELGFNGVAVTDWEDIHKLFNYHMVARNEKEATRMVIEAGIDMAMTPTTTGFYDYTLELVREGAIPESRIDESVRRILHLKFDLGLFEHPMPRNDRFDRIGSEAHQKLALDAARESIVLLKNEGSVLPLKDDTQNILVVGPSANSRRNLSGGWTLGWLGRPENEYPEDLQTVYTALKKLYPKAAVQLMEAAGEAGSQARNRFELAASRADVIISAVGEEPYAETPGNINDLGLPADQRFLLQAVEATGRPHVIVMIGGRPRVMTQAINDADAFVFAGLPGFEGGTAIAEILAGKVNPSGKLAISYPSSPGHNVPYNHKVNDQSTALFPFGAGLSYTTFEYSNLALSDTLTDGKGPVTATVRVTNTGDRAGMESVLWFLQDEVRRITPPVRELHHYQKIELAPGASKKVTFTIRPRDLSYPNHRDEYLMEDGYFNVQVGKLKQRFLLKQ